MKSLSVLLFLTMAIIAGVFGKPTKEQLDSTIMGGIEVSYFVSKFI